MRSVITVLVLLSAFSGSAIAQSSTTSKKPSTSPKAASQRAKEVPLKTPNNNWTFEKVQGSKLLFEGGQSFETGLFDLEYIGQINPDKKPPFLIFSGRDCNECDANISIYFHSPRNGPLDVMNGKNRYTYPGKVTHYENNHLIYEASAYYGEVLRGVNGLIWYQKSQKGKETWPESIFLARIAGDSIVLEDILENIPDKKAETLALKKSGKNTEIQGREYTSEP